MTVEGSPMTEHDWLACTDLPAMLEYLQGKVSDRKLRLFGVACCYRIWHLLTDKLGKEAVEIAQRLAEGKHIDVDLVSFTEHVWNSGFAYIDGFNMDRESNGASHAVNAAYHCLPDVLPRHAFAGLDSLRPNLVRVPQEAAWAVAHSRRRENDDHLAIQADLVWQQELVAAFQQDLTEQVPMLHDIIGLLPFRLVTLDSSWLSSNVVAIARSIYDKRAFGEMPILADALEGTGCRSEAILNDCRKAGPHVRGCWAIDLLLGRE